MSTDFEHTILTGPRFDLSKMKIFFFCFSFFAKLEKMLVDINVKNVELNATTHRCTLEQSLARKPVVPSHP